MATKKVAGLVTDVLHSVGVRRIYGVVGDSLNGITESLRKHGDIDWIHTRHEEAAAFAGSDLEKSMKANGRAWLAA
jgi:pyruvate dehydrogenase (quinone)